MTTSRFGSRTGRAAAALALCALAFSGNAPAEEAAAPAAPQQIGVIRSGIPHDAIYEMAIEGATGYAVGAFGVILESKDGGTSWAATSSPTNLALLGIAMLGDKRIIVGQRGTVLLGKEGGGWEAAKSGTESRLMGISVNSKGVALSVGEFGTIILSHDGGKSWSPIELDWEKFAEGGYQPHMYIARVEESGRLTVGGEFGLVLVSEDDGKTWTSKHKSDESLFAMHVLEDGTGFGVGQKGLVIKTVDNGNTWEKVDVGGDANLLGVWVSKQGEVVITGIRALIRSSDAGATWTHSGDPQVLRNWYQAIGIGEAKVKTEAGPVHAQVVYIGGARGMIAQVLR
ncbi:MAG: photosystem II stability/assembly factor-like protein [Gammaproteobacteria bacterium]|nr:photosystem II stability/assembly factor-like protein [Gammaproteobacteria bacterium]